MDTTQIAIENAITLNMKIAQELQKALDKYLKDRETPRQIATIYNQRDPRWAEIVLGTGQTTIGKEGCLISCIASILSDAGISDANPAWLNDWLIGNGGYIDGNRLVFSAIDNSNAVRFGELINCPEQNQVPFEKIISALANDNFVIAKVDFNRGGTFEQHWVRVISIQCMGEQPENAMIVDPWYGDIDQLCPRYGKNAAIAIWAVATFIRTDSISGIS